MTTQRRISVVTGTRAEYGLLRPVLTAIADEPRLACDLVATGAHLRRPARTVDEVLADHPNATVLPMHDDAADAPDAHAVGRDADAAALGRGVSVLAAHFAAVRPDVVLVLGDRIEAFAAAAAAAVGGIRVAHVHGGDRAEGVADEGMRHAITKLAHLHFAASARSAERLLCLGEPPPRVQLVGSPAIDGLSSVPALDDAAYEDLGAPELLVLLHPTGEPDAVEAERAGMLLDACTPHGRVLCLEPNHDPGRTGIMTALAERPWIPRRSHLDRPTFIGLLRRVRLLAGNSSAGRIEAAAIPRRVVDIGPRQAGRERPRNVLHAPGWDADAVRRLVDRGWHEPVLPFTHPYGDGRAGARIADHLATVDFDTVPIAKRNTF